jgi:hypothetical protein
MIHFKRTPFHLARFVVASSLYAVLSCSWDSDPVCQTENFAYLADNRHHIYERSVEVYHHPSILASSTITMELHYVDMKTGKDSILFSGNAGCSFLQFVNPSDSTFTILNPDSALLCIKADLSATRSGTPRRFLLKNGTVAVNFSYNPGIGPFSITDLQTGSTIQVNHSELDLLAAHDCGILTQKTAVRSSVDSIMIVDLSGKVTAAMACTSMVRIGTYVGANQFAYQTNDSLLHFVDAQDLHEVSVKKLPDLAKILSISPDGKKLMMIGWSSEFKKINL